MTSFYESKRLKPSSSGDHGAEGQLGQRYLMRRVPSSYKDGAPARCQCLYSDLLASSAGQGLGLGHWSQERGDQHQGPMAKKARVGFSPALTSVDAAGLRTTLGETLLSHSKK